MGVPPDIVFQVYLVIHEFFALLPRRDQTSMRYQTHYQLKQKLWLSLSEIVKLIGGNELIHSGLFQVYHLGFGSS